MGGEDHLIWYLGNKTSIFGTIHIGKEAPYMKNLLLQIFTLWNGQTLGTRFYTWRKGHRVGEDEAGNIYYEGDDNKRWVIYNGPIEASNIPAGWHGWLHHRTDTAPSQETYQRHEWELGHQQNLTGTAGAYRPKGAVASQDKRPAVSGDYESWSP